MAAQLRLYHNLLLYQCEVECDTRTGVVNINSANAQEFAIKRTAPGPLQKGLATSTSLQSHFALRKRKAACSHFGKEKCDGTALGIAGSSAVQYHYRCLIITSSAHKNTS
ncbi:hypothetical protein KIN20_015037 [Parelaphostrongylus tenuis]|uniref:Uncharacterized protein n=1 Tax=Parelaphostrongylus tenuis TaxID=148309 RepID=A0AAD5MIX8_PARTN|nr:hypothetical protein KIN20_015037 [Parelaphostrongylus tenuis]